MNNNIKAIISYSEQVEEEKSINSAKSELFIMSGSAISDLVNLKRDSRLSSPMKDQVNHLLQELRFFNLYTQCFAMLKGREIRSNFNFLDIKAKLEGAMRGLHRAGIKALDAQDCQDWDNLTSELLERVQVCKPKIVGDLRTFQKCSFLECSYRKFSHLERSLPYGLYSLWLQNFCCCLSASLNDLVTFKDGTISDRNTEIQGMKERLQLLIEIFEFNQIMDKRNNNVKDFRNLIQTWLYNVAWLSLWYWIDEGKQEIEGAKDNFIRSTTRMKSTFLVVLRRLWSSSQNRLLMHKGVLKYADLFMEILQLHPFKDDIEMLHNGLIFVTTFLMDPPVTKDAESISKEVNSRICSRSAIELKRVAVEKINDLDNTLLEKMNRVRTEVRKLYANLFQDLSSINFPSTNLLGFLDSLSKNLEGTSEHSTNHEVVKVQKELQSIRPFLGTILEFQKENIEMKDLWTQIVNVVYRAKIGIQLLLYVNSSVCYDLKCLSHITEEIKLLKNELNKIQDQEISNVKVPVAEKYTSPARANKLEINEELVGFEDETETIIDHLIGGSSALKIVSIFGMAGQGKTTLAKKIYHNPAVQKHFDKRAWCCVSQTYQNKKLFLEILSDIAPDGDYSSMTEEELEQLHGDSSFKAEEELEQLHGDSSFKAEEELEQLHKDYSSMTEEELEQLLYQRLLGHKFLIVIDDIWDIRAWNALKLSFPDQNNGSRIIFTSRIKDLALHAKRDCILHPLRQLSSDESLELLRKKLFGTADFHPYLMDVAKRIANDCNGLPLVVVVITGILSEKVDDLDWWNHIAQSVHSQANNDCKDLLEQSYKHLPEFLKPCFLYFGAFPEDSVIKVRKLTQLWISEGFIQKSEAKNLEDVANEYLMNLVARSLVMVAQRSSTGGIKACCIHDLLHTFCLEKGRKENFLQVGSWGKESPCSTHAVIENYRMCVQTREIGFGFRSSPCVQSLLFLTVDRQSFDTDDLFSICNLKLLQVLDMEGVKFSGDSLEEVVVLVHLRYFAVMCDCSVSVPPSIANLKYLETFRVKSSSTFGNKFYLPNTIWTMKSLWHIDVVDAIFDDSEPPESSVLENIQTFSATCLRYGETAEKLLRRIPNVRKLRCQFLDSCYLCNNYRMKEVRCAFQDSFDSNQFPVLEFLSQLESLHVEYTGNLYHHCAFSFPLSLKKLTLRYFVLSRNQISTIAKLPELEVLKLVRCHFDGKTWDLQDDEFPKLKFLKLEFSNMRKWTISGDYPFPCLEQLIVGGCFDLEEIPYLFAESISTMKKIEVRLGKPAVVRSARQIQEDFEHVEVIIID